jgi:hypothetical protein
MKQTSLKSVARHMAAVRTGKVDKTNIIGIRKAINAIERDGETAAMIDAVFKLERHRGMHRPAVVGSLHDSGLKVLRNPRYAKRWTARQQLTIANLDHFELIRFDRLGDRGRYSVPVYRVVSRSGGSFAFRNIPWQTAYFGGLDDGPRVVPECH